MLKNIKFLANKNSHYRRFSLAVKYNNNNFCKLLDESNEIKYNKELKYFYEEKTPFYTKKHLDHIIANDLCSICHICKGCGWITDNNVNNGLNFGFKICKSCKGTGFN